MSDIYLNWKKISRILPKVRRYALDRIATIEEIREILDASEIRSKALTLVFVSSGIREGAIEMLRVGDYSHIKRDGETVAGRLVVCAGDPEQYLAFITYEACEPWIITWTLGKNMTKMSITYPHYSVTHSIPFLPRITKVKKFQKK